MTVTNLNFLKNITGQFTILITLIIGMIILALYLLKKEIRSKK